MELVLAPRQVPLPGRVPPAPMLKSSKDGDKRSRRHLQDYLSQLVLWPGDTRQNLQMRRKAQVNSFIGDHGTVFGGLFDG